MLDLHQEDVFFVFFHVGCVVRLDIVLQVDQNQYVLYVTLAEEQTHAVTYSLFLIAPHLSNSCLHSQS